MWLLQLFTILFVQNVLSFEYSSFGEFSAVAPLQRMRLSADAYRGGLGKIANIGECVDRLDPKTKQRITCNRAVAPKVGSTRYYPRPRTEIVYRRMESTHQGTSILSIGVSVGVGTLFGLLKASVEVKGTTTLKTSATSIILMARMDYTRGVISITDTGKEIINLNSHLNDKYYVSDILLGTQEALYVKMDFESWQKKTEVEIKIKIKILFFTISATMKFLFESGDAAGHVQVVRTSTYQNKVENREFKTGSFKAASDFVEGIEKEFSALPSKLRTVPNNQLHRIYSLLPYKRDYRNYIADTPLKLLYVKLILTHQADAEDARDMSNDTLTKSTLILSTKCKQQLQTLRTLVVKKIQEFEDILLATYTLTDAVIKDRTERAIGGKLPHDYKTSYFSILNEHNVPY